MGPPQREDLVTPHTRPPADSDADHLLVRTVECLEGRVEIELVCEPVFDYGRTPAEWTLVEGAGTRRTRPAPARRSLHTDMALGIEANQVRARHTSIGATDSIAPSRGDTIWRVRPTSTTPSAGSRPRSDSGGTGSDGPGSPTIAGGTRSSDPPSRSGPHVRADRRDGRRPHHVAAGDPRGERNWDYRYSWMRDSTFTLQALHWLNLDWEAEEFIEFIADLEPNDDGAMQIMYGIDGRRDLTESARRPLGLRRRATGPDRQRGVRSAAERCLRRRAGLDPAAHPPEPAAPTPLVADRPGPGGVRHERVAGARSRDGRRVAHRSTTSPRS